MAYRSAVRVIGATIPLDPSVPVPGAFARSALLSQLAQTLDARGIRYCQWKGHWSAHRWMSGLGEVDLLVDHHAIAEIRRLLGEIGFKSVLASAERQIPGIESYLGHDPAIQRPLHLRVHYRLMIGDFWKPMYRIPIEGAVLESSRPTELFRIPSPTHQLLIFVLRVMLRQVGRPLLPLQTRWLAGIQPPLLSLESAADEAELETTLLQQLPAIDLALFRRCARSLQGRSGMLERAMLPFLLSRRLKPHLRRPPIAALVTRAIQKLLPRDLADSLLQRHMRLTGVGTLVALEGSEGMETSICARELASWLAPVLRVLRAPLDNPPRTLLSRVVVGVLRLDTAVRTRLARPASSGSTLELLRHVCTARDRYLLYARLSRFATAGGITLAVRYPGGESRRRGPGIPGLLPREPGFLARALRDWEESYYRRISRPDLTCLLCLGPAVPNGTSTETRVIDAARPLPEVMAELKSVIWQSL